MEFDYRYHGQSSVEGNSSQTNMSFSPDTLRDPTYFIGDLAQPVAFREAMSTLHHVVVSDLRYKPRDKSEYLNWLKQEEESLLAGLLADKPQIESRLSKVREKLETLRYKKNIVLLPFYRAQQMYFNYLYKHDMNAWMVLDPVITVHPDQVFFECFSLDESCYGKLACKLDVFKNVSEFACGTTNIDYSAELYNEFQKIRDYKNTRFHIDPGGFEVKTCHEERFVEQKIDLPDSWVRGFLQVSSAMTLERISFDLHPMDIHNFCFVLRRQKERVGPRSIRFELTPGQPVKAIFEPWNHEVVCHRSIYNGKDKHEIRIWGRRRLLILQRLIPLAKKFTVDLLGSGLPSFFQADLGDMTFTLGLSGWTASDFSRLGNFDLMAPREQVSEFTLDAVFTALKKVWFSSANDIARQLQIERSQALAALAVLTQAGRVIYDMTTDVYRLRELSREPLPMSELRFSNEQEQKADNFVNANLVTVTNATEFERTLNLAGTVMDNARTLKTELTVDGDQRLTKGRCECSFYHQNRLFKGPCEHMLALRRAHAARNEKPDTRRMY